MVGERWSGVDRLYTVSQQTGLPMPLFINIDINYCDLCPAVGFALRQLQLCANCRRHHRVYWLLWSYVMR